MRRPAMAAALAALALVAGCAQNAAGSAGHPAAGHRAAQHSGPSLAALRTKADLSPCPPATAHAAGQLPDVRLPCLGGGAPVTLDRIRGVPMLVNLWASWCRPCYQEMPVLQRVYAKAGGRLRILGVDTSDTREGALRAAADTGARYPSLFDPHHRVATGLGRNTQPTTVFVRANGSIAYVQAAPLHDAAQVEQLVRRYLGVRL